MKFQDLVSRLSFLSSKTRLPSFLQITPPLFSKTKNSKTQKKTPRFPIVRKIKEKNCTSSANFTSLLFPLPKKQNKKNPPSKKGGPQQARNNLDIANRYRLSSIHPEEGGDNAPVSFGYRLENSEMGTGPRIRVSREKGLILGIPPRQLERPWPGSR